MQFVVLYFKTMLNVGTHIWWLVDTHTLYTYILGPIDIPMSIASRMLRILDLGSLACLTVVSGKV